MFNARSIEKLLIARYAEIVTLLSATLDSCSSFTPSKESAARTPDRYCITQTFDYLLFFKYSLPERARLTYMWKAFSTLGSGLAVSNGLRLASTAISAGLLESLNPGNIGKGNADYVRGSIVLLLSTPDLQPSWNGTQLGPTCPSSTPAWTSCQTTAPPLPSYLCPMPPGWLATLSGS